MTNRIYLDANTLVHAFDAVNGNALITTYIQHARASGFMPVVTDVVRDEIFRGPKAAILDLFTSLNVETVSTLEGVNYRNYQAGNGPAGYTLANSGERSIRPLPSSKGWMHSKYKCAMPALASGCNGVDPFGAVLLNQVMKPSISGLTRVEGTASK